MANARWTRFLAVCLCYFNACLISSYCDTTPVIEDLYLGFSPGTTELSLEKSNSVLILSTLDGSLIGVDPQSGDIKWKDLNEPAVKVPVNPNKTQFPLFLPNPKDGTLYILNSGEPRVLKKLPFSIQRLVASSPCRSNDGIFYTGKKIDKWFSIDCKTGVKSPLLSFEGADKTCPISSSDALLLGRTEYNIIMYDSKRSNHHWNVTFFDYAAQVLTPDELNSYGFVHIGGSKSGRVQTVDRASGSLLWEKDFGSPLIALYLKRGQDLAKLPFTSIADTTFEKLSFHQRDQLYSTLFIGEHQHGLYALPSYVGDEVPILPLSSSPSRLLISGPVQPDANSLIFGHYQMPDIIKTQLQITGRSDPIISTNLSNSNSSLKSTLKMEVKSTQVSNSDWRQNVENKFLSAVVAVLIVSVVAMFLYFRAQVRDIQNSSRGSSQGSSNYKTAIEVQEGIIQIGKITFNAQHILGKGCEGTFVFKGDFEGRHVAVKRLLPDCFTVADREVTLLRESDEHPNVIRYYCMEQDSQFRYIALELCSATLQDYVEKGIHKEDISNIEVLLHATLGLEHLHNLKIVHRDIKPHNILLSASSTTCKVRAMISDFGLCKKLQNGRFSFSRRSGVTGTDGWIAPEMIESDGRTMCSVDIFSLGCVFYYVMSGGHHPFGEPLRRQANILSAEYKISSLKDDMLWYTLVEKMISSDPFDRPSSYIVKIHPVFWSPSNILIFLQDASDRLEKEDLGSEILACLERGGQTVCDSDWRNSVDPELGCDLRKYRTYKGDSVRDLLRAIRNKKHHFRELSEEAQALLGPSTETYVKYWLTKFPLLFFHTWARLQVLRAEHAFSKYYHSEYIFPGTLSTDLPQWMTSSPEKRFDEKFLKKSPRKYGKGFKSKTNSEENWRQALDNNEWRQKQSAEAEVLNDKINWIKFGKSSGIWRPRDDFNGVRKRDKKRDSDNLVWKLPPETSS